jgi:hypothetical protein
MFANQPDTISGWTFWTWKKTNNGLAYLVDIPAPGIRSLLFNYLY